MPSHTNYRHKTNTPRAINFLLFCLESSRPKKELEVMEIEPTFFGLTAADLTIKHEWFVNPVLDERPLGVPLPLRGFCAQRPHVRLLAVRVHRLLPGALPQLGAARQQSARAGV